MFSFNTFIAPYTIFIQMCVWLLCGWGVSLPALAFDTSWHYKSSQAVIDYYELPPHSARILHIGTWGPDYYQVFQLLIGEKLKYLEDEHSLRLIPGIKQALRQASNLGEEHIEMQKRSVFMHFDNIHFELEENKQFDALFKKLFNNLVHLLSSTYTNPHFSVEKKRSIMLLALGSALHMVQDFYAHTNWVDLDFAQYHWRWRQLSTRAPTYFEAKQVFGAGFHQPPEFPFLIESGIYEGGEKTAKEDLPKTQQGIPKSHDYLSHDHTQLNSATHDNVRLHNCGAVPTAQFSAVLHQQFAVQTAMAASLEWMRWLKQSDKMKVVFELIKQPVERRLFRDASDHLILGMKRSSCLVGAWDGSHPIASEAHECKAAGLSISHVMLEVLHGYHEPLPTPFNEFWQLYLEQDIIGQLIEGLGDLDSGHYIFSP